MEYENDFGFSAVDESDIRRYETELQQKLDNHTQTSLSEIEKLNDLLNKSKKQTKDLFNAILPLLKNLQENQDRQYILWPDRAKKIAEFEKKLRLIINND